MSTRAFTLVTTVALTAAAALTGCSSDDSELRQIRPGATVYIDAVDEDADAGDQALLEKKPSGLWVIPLKAHFRSRKGRDFTARVELTREGVWRFDPETTRVGKDHDDCLEDGEAYAQLAVPEAGLRFEPDRGGSKDGDDCVTPSGG